MIMAVSASFYAEFMNVFAIFFDGKDMPGYD